MDSARGAEAAMDRDRKEPLGDPTGMSRPGAGEFLPEAAMADAVLGASCVDPPIPCTAANVSAVGGGVEFRRLLGAKSRRGRSGGAMFSWRGWRRGRPSMLIGDGGAQSEAPREEGKQEVVPVSFASGLQLFKRQHSIPSGDARVRGPGRWWACGLVGL